MTYTMIWVEFLCLFRIIYDKQKIRVGRISKFLSLLVWNDISWNLIKNDFIGRYVLTKWNTVKLKDSRIM